MSEQPTWSTRAAMAGEWAEHASVDDLVRAADVGSLVANELSRIPGGAEVARVYWALRGVLDQANHHNHLSAAAHAQALSTKGRFADPELTAQLVKQTRLAVDVAYAATSTAGELAVIELLTGNTVLDPVRDLISYEQAARTELLRRGHLPALRLHALPVSRRDPDFQQRIRDFCAHRGVHTRPFVEQPDTGLDLQP